MNSKRPMRVSLAASYSPPKELSLSLLIHVSQNLFGISLSRCYVFVLIAGLLLSSIHLQSACGQTTATWKAASEDKVTLAPLKPTGTIDRLADDQALSGDTLEQLQRELASLRSQVQDLQNQSRTAPSRLETAQSSVGPESSGQRTPSSAAPNNPNSSPDEKRKSSSTVERFQADGWDVKLGGHVQMDYVMWPERDPAIVDPNARNYFNYRRLRLVADGKGYGVYDFRLQMTLEPGQGADLDSSASPDVKDAYLTIHEVPFWGRLRFGNFFVPFSLEQVTNDTNNIFLERSIPTQGIFAVDREVGVGFYNCSADQLITWSGGVFFDNLSDTFKTRVDNNQGLHVAGRLTWLPFYDEASQGRYLMHTGVGVLYTDDHDDVLRFLARPQTQRSPALLDTGNFSGDDYWTGNLEWALVWGSVTWQSEAFLCSVPDPVGGAALLGGAYAHVSYFLTGENRIFERFGQHGAQFGRNEPRRNFQVTQSERSWGAWEAKARWSYLDLTELASGQYNDLSVGVNWYWSDRTRLMLDWIHPLTDSQARFGSIESDLIGLRLDFCW